MLIYNSQKEFLGMDEKGLHSLGFKNLQGLRAEVSDFSDLFVKTPGYIHNFKHVHWIDFITCAESNEESKVIININNKNYTATLHITTAFLIDNPSSKAYLVNLNNLRELTSQESEKISGDIVAREIPMAAAEPKQIFNRPEVSDDFEKTSYKEEPVTPSAVTPDPYETPLEVDLSSDEPLEVETFDEIVSPTEKQEIPEKQEIKDDFDAPLDIDIDFDDEEDAIEVNESVPLVNTTTTQITHENYDNGYIYDPHVASEELGLPLDLIEEFIQDFIEQAKEFKDDLYRYLNDNDLDNLKTLSHKLKGVAANLRVEDALEHITIVNTESNINLIAESLDTFYKIIAKLSGEEITVEKEVPIENTPQEETLNLDFKDEVKEEETDLYSDPVEINDADVPQKIDMPELADDTFLTDEVETASEIENFDEPELNLTIQDEEPKLDIDLEFASDPEIEPESDIELAIKEPIVINYSKESAAAEIGLDVESYNELFDDYIEETKEMLTSMKGAAEVNDFDVIANEATKLNGMSENMKVNSFEDEIATLSSTKNTQEIADALKKIEKIIDKLSNKEG